MCRVSTKADSTLTKLVGQLTIRSYLWLRNILALAGLLFVILLATNHLSIAIYSL
ncbi:lysis protein [Pseudomonas phage PRRlime]